MQSNMQDSQALIDAWHTNHRVTVYLIENLPPELWTMRLPGYTRRTVRNVAAHVHNGRCMWVRHIGEKHGVKVPKMVDPHKVTQRQLSRDLERSSKGMVDLIHLGADRGGKVPPAKWQNFPTDLFHFLSYFIAHEAHHRGQLIMLAKQLGFPLSREIAGGLWQWKKLSKDGQGKP